MNLFASIATFITNRHILTWKMLLLIAGIGYAFPVLAKAPRETYEPEWVATFYKARNNKPFWFADSTGKILRECLLLVLEHCATQGLEPDRYPIEALKNYQDADAVTGVNMTADRLYTSAAMTYLETLLTGNTLNSITGSDALWEQEMAMDRKLVADLLAGCKRGFDLDSIAKSLEPATSEYLVLKSALAVALQAGQQDTIKLLQTALNSYRRIHHHHYPKCVVVNIASGLLRYYERDSLKLEMRVVTGKPSTPTPRFTAYCNEVIFYPYWNVPRSIAVNELLPLCKRAPGVLAFMNMQVLDSKGRVSDAKKIKWQQYNAKNFPYRFRQATGCDNALGVIKFNLNSPYGVYLHDTNAKLSFAAKKRYFSHGCIRLEKPVELAGFLLDKELDSDFLSACLRDEQPHSLKLPEPVPVLVIYVRADAGTNGSIAYYDDVYKLN